MFLEENKNIVIKKYNRLFGVLCQVVGANLGLSRKRSNPAQGQRRSPGVLRMCTFGKRRVQKNDFLRLSNVSFLDFWLKF
jgi:hypothetical protein